MKKYTLFFAVLVVSLTSYAQSSWQWGLRGGSSGIGGSGGAGPDETVVDMATDVQGNTYVLSKAYQTGLTVDGHAITGWDAQNILISSFKCDGTYRWSKIIGGLQDANPMALKTDTLGGVYVTGYYCINFSTLHIDSDTSLVSYTNYKSLFLVKFDTAGTYKWIRMPQPDTAGITAYSYTAAIDMDVDKNGNIYMLCSLSPGAYAGGAYIAPSLGYYMLEYDKDGNFLSSNPIQISAPTSSGNIALFKIKEDFQSGRYYVTGNYCVTGGFSFDGIPIAHPGFIGCFNSAGVLLWQQQDTDPLTFYSAFGRAAIDGQHNIYIAGRASNADTFNTYAMLDGGSTAEPVIYKLDTNGNNIWAKNATVNGATFCSSVTINGSEADIAGEYPGLLKWDGYPDSLNLPINSDYHIFITRFNAATGAVLGIDSLASTFGAFNESTAITSDRFGNFYVGGDFADEITVNGTTLSSSGGGSDFFVAKYGTNNCSALISLGTVVTQEQTGPVNVYPNPATDELNITGVLQNTNYRLYSITGTMIQTSDLRQGDNTIALGNLAQGIYMLELTGADGSKRIIKVVKE